MKKNLFILCAIFLLITSCTQTNNEDDKALKYLSCYALSPDEKISCKNNLNERYLDPTIKHYDNYVREFEFAWEKQGFKEFIIKQNLPCKLVNSGPIFSKEKNGYLVDCNDKNQYLMTFDYGSNKWILAK